MLNRRFDPEGRDRALVELVEDQEEDEDNNDKDRISLHPIVEAGLVAGLQFNREHVAYESAWLVNAIASYQWSKKVYFGLGAGVMKFEDETFLPVFADFKGFFKKNKSAPFFSGQLGYSFAWSSMANRAEDYNYLGGIMFSSGGGYKINAGDNMAVLLAVSYMHQFAHLRYDTNFGTTFNERADFDLLMFKIDLFFK